jgi:hypothetical protein
MANEDFNEYRDRLIANMKSGVFRYDFAKKLYKLRGHEDPRDAYFEPNTVQSTMEFYGKWVQSAHEENGLMSVEVKEFLKKIDYIKKIQK